MSAQLYGVVLAGGKGERFWPMSTAERPKQLLSLIEDCPMVVSSVKRLQPLIPLENIFVITNADLVGTMRDVMPELPKENIIGEPVGKDTAAAAALGTAVVRARNPEGVICVVTADHVISEIPLFQSTFRHAADIAAKEEVLVTIGMEPSFPSTGFGYIETGEKHSENEGVEFFSVKQFVEKPDRATATKYVERGNFYWNSGMFIWSIKSFQNSATAHCRWLSDFVDKVASSADECGPLDDQLKRLYPDLEKISIDYALMEKSSNIIMAKGTFPWDDVGTWASLRNHFQADAQDNIVVGVAECIDSSGNIIITEGSVAGVIGIKDLVIVQSGSSILVCHKQRTQDVKQLVARLKNKEHLMEE